MENFIEQVNPYFHRYIQLVPEPDALNYLEKNLENSARYFSEISEEQSLYSYAPGKWSIKEVLGHLLDTERIFAYRALRIARNDKTPLPGFEQDDYVASAGFNSLKWDELVRQFWNLRLCTIDMFKSFDEEAMLREGTTSGSPNNVKAILFILAGHEIHHVNVLNEKYLNIAAG